MAPYVANSDVGGAYLSTIYSKDSLFLFAVEQSRYFETSDADHFLQLTDVTRSSGFNPLALELDIYSLEHHLCKMCIFYEPRRVTLGNTRHFVEEERKMVRESLQK